MKFCVVLWCDMSLCVIKRNATIFHKLFFYHFIFSMLSYVVVSYVMMLSKKKTLSRGMVWCGMFYCGIKCCNLYLDKMWNVLKWYGCHDVECCMKCYLTTSYFRCCHMLCNALSYVYIVLLYDMPWRVMTWNELMKCCFEVLFYDGVFMVLSSGAVSYVMCCIMLMVWNVVWSVVLRRRVNDVVLCCGVMYNALSYVYIVLLFEMSWRVMIWSELMKCCFTMSSLWC